MNDPLFKQMLGDANAYRGSCLCGGVSFAVSGLRGPAAHCYCTMCRKFHGAAFSTFVNAEQLTWISGNELLKEYIAPNGTTRIFCRECGSSIAFKGMSPDDKLEIAASLFDEIIPNLMDSHVYTSYKACWFEILDDLPQFKEGRNDFVLLEQEIGSGDQR